MERDLESLARAAGLGAGMILVAGRMLGMVLAAPAWSLPALGIRIRILMSAMLAAAVAPAAMRPAQIAELGELSGGGLFWAAVIELGIGLALGLGLSLIVAAIRTGGEVVGTLAGTMPASLAPIDGDDGEVEASPLSALFGMLALAAFLALDGPFHLVDLVVASYDAVPAGGRGLTLLGLAGAAFRHVGDALGMALAAAAPVGLALLLAELALAWALRAAPSLARAGVGPALRWALVVALLLTATLAGLNRFGPMWLDGTDQWVEALGSAREPR